MNILLVEPAYYTQFPSLALLKLGAYHKSKGDAVKYLRGTKPVLGKFDKIYVTSLYTWAWRPVIKAISYYRALFPDAEIVLGGLYATLHSDHVKEHASIDHIHKGELPRKVEKLRPAYELLEEVDRWRGWKASIIYSSRGCTRKCPFCAVPIVEGELKPEKSIKKYVEKNHRWIVLWDNDFLSSPYHNEIFNELKGLGKHVDFNQGLRAEQISLDVAKELAKIDLRLFPSGDKGIRIAYDFLEQGEYVKEAIENLARAGFRRDEILVYNLYNFHETPDDFFERVRNTLRWGAKSYPMRYQPLVGKESLTKNSYVDEKAGWTREKLDWVKKGIARFGGKKGGKGVLSPYKALLNRMEGSKNFEEMFKPW